MSEAPAVFLEGLAKSYGQVEAVKGLDMCIPRGSMAALVGPDGAGKSTTIRMLCGLAAPDSGRLELLGLDWAGHRDELKRRIGYLSQRFSLYGDLSVDENIEFFAELHEVSDFAGRRDELLEFTRLAPFRGRLAERLSGGMKQKLALACTLIHKPDVIFLDEPTTGVDPVSRRDFWTILSRLLRGGITILMATPYMDEAERCDPVILMHRGAAVMSGSPETLKRGLEGGLFELVCHDARAMAGRLAGLDWIDEVEVFGDRLHVLSRRSGAAGRLAGLAGEADGPAEVREIRPGIEDVFVHLLRRPGGEGGQRHESID